MAFLENLKDKASDAAIVAGKAVNEVYESTKLKMAIAEKKGTLKALYKEVGELVYKSYKSGDSSAEALEDKMVEIDTVCDEIETLKAQQMKIKKVRTCTSCGSSIPEDCNFCPKCGTEVTEEEPEVEVVDEGDEE